MTCDGSYAFLTTCTEPAVRQGQKRDRRLRAGGLPARSVDWNRVHRELCCAFSTRCTPSSPTLLSRCDAGRRRSSCEDRVGKDEVLRTALHMVNQKL